MKRSDSIFTRYQRVGSLRNQDRDISDFEPDPPATEAVKKGLFRKRTCAPRSQSSHLGRNGPFTNSRVLTSAGAQVRFLKGDGFFSQNLPRGGTDLM